MILRHVVCINTSILIKESGASEVYSINDDGGFSRSCCILSVAYDIVII